MRQHKVKERFFLLIPLTTVLLCLVSWLKPPMDDKLSERKRFWLEKTHTREQFDVVIGGDSRIYRGVAPEAMKEILPDYSIFNFGYSSGSLSKQILKEIDKRLLPNASSKVVVLGITPHALTPHAALDNHFREQKAQAHTALFSYRYFYPLNQWTEPLRLSALLEKALGKDKDEAVYHQEYRQNGWIASDKTPANPKEALEGYKEAFEDNLTNEKMIKDLLAQVKYWSDKGTNVFAFRPPTTTVMYEMEETLSGFEEAIFINQFQAVGGHWITVSQTDFESYDGSHLTKESAIELSRILAKEIKLRLSL